MNTVTYLHNEDTLANRATLEISNAEVKARAGLFGPEFGISATTHALKHVGSIVEAFGDVEVTFLDASRALPNAYRGGDATWLELTRNVGGEWTVKAWRGFAPHGAHGGARIAWTKVYAPRDGVKVGYKWNGDHYLAR